MAKAKKRYLKNNDDDEALVIKFELHGFFLRFREICISLGFVIGAINSWTNCNQLKRSYQFWK